MTTPPPYGSAALSACAKADFIWNERILPSRYAQLPPLTTPGLHDLLALLSSHYSVKALSHEGDEMEPGRRKLVHAFGAEARLKLVVDPASSHGYTGIFHSGGDCVIGRFSMASKPSADRSIPGLALKFFIDGDRPSLDLLVMNSADGQAGHNFFSQSFSNIIPPPKGLAVRVLGAAFGRSAKLYGAKDPNPGRLTLEHLASMTPDGVPVADPREPYQLIFKPTEQATALMQGSPASEDFRVSLARLPVGAVLYQLYARTTSDEKEAPRLLGHLVLASPVVSSSYGDQTLYFRHNMARR
ncbi:hypothetical protein [Niveibacterium terrae]|uniref:hypothetical protein n=1 Tax=Niveibacterium terrae TaxID=3373598 RepID=UPI003A8D5D7D